MESFAIVPCAKRLSVTVGTGAFPETVPSVRSTGPMPRMPSTPWKPCADEATPMLWFWMTSWSFSETVSVSVAETTSAMRYIRGAGV